MSIVDRCPICGHSLSFEEVEKLLKGGNNMASVKVKAGVCHKCGEIIFDSKTVEKFELLRKNLREGDVKKLKPVGKAYAA